MLKIRIDRQYVMDEYGAGKLVLSHSLRDPDIPVFLCVASIAQCASALRPAPRQTPINCPVDPRRR